MSEPNGTQPQKPPAQEGPPRPGQGGGGGGGAAPGVRRMNRGPIGWIALLLLFAMVLAVANAMEPRRESIKWAEFTSYHQENALSDIVLADNAITAKVTEGDNEKLIKVDVNPATKEHWVAELQTLTNGDFKESPGPPFWLLLLTNPFLWTLLLFVVIFLFISRAMRGAAGGGGMLGSFGKSRHRVLQRENTKVKFTEVAGIQEAKDEVQEIVEFLKSPKKFMRLGGRIPRGVLLTGPPGCGKTLLAKAIAGEADVPFFTISGSDFVEMFVGVGASRVRDLFKQAKESSPCIIFLDEIDAVGRRRGSGVSSGGHDEREQTLNAILVEMDGFESSDQVIVIAATNRPDVLDPALTRPGRFDRQIEVPPPDIKGRYEILQVHAKKVKMSPAVDLERVARATPMFSGAELAALINEAAIMATLSGKEYVEQDDLEEARDKIRFGRSRRSRVIEEKERLATAYHEAGHAVLQMLLPHSDPLHKVTIIPRGSMGGATFSLPEKDRYGFGAQWILATMRIVCGGRIAEKRKTNDVTSGAAMDIQQLTQLARAMVLEWGMSDKLGFVRYAGTDSRETYMPEREYSEETARLIDEEIRRFADEAFRAAEELLDANWEKVEAVAEALLKHETLTRDEVEKLMAGQSLDKPTIRDLLDAEASKRERPKQTPKPADEDRPDEGLSPGLAPA